MCTSDLVAQRRAFLTNHRHDLVRFAAWHEEERAETAAAYHALPNNFHTAWHYLHTHPIVTDALGMSRLSVALDIFVAKVDPVTHCVEDDESRNTLSEVWLELGPVYRPDDCPDAYLLEMGEMRLTTAQPTHDYTLDTGAETFETAIVNLAATVSAQYGDDRSKVYE